ncbi:hypothetical protein RUND412_002324 [Rhizina undulata]
MASPENNRVGGSRGTGGSGGGVKNLLAMFEKSSQSSPGASGSKPVSRDSSPGPRPLTRVRTSFVAVGGSKQELMGLQKLPVSPIGLASPISLAGGARMVGEALDREKLIGLKIDGTVTNGGKLEDESIIVVNGNTPPAKVPEVEKSGFSPEPEKAAAKTEEVSAEKVLDKQESDKPKQEAAIAPKSPPKPPAGAKPSKLAASKPTTKNLSKSHKSTPVRSPTEPKSPFRRTASATSSTSGTQRKTPAATTKPATTTKPRTAATNGTSTTTTTTKPRQPMAPPPVPKPKSATATKPESKARETTKPVAGGRIHAPTAASVARQEKAAAQRRPGSVASVRSKTPHDARSPPRLRRQNSYNSTHNTKKDAKPPSRPATSTANRPTKAVASNGHPPAPNGDFMSRMMRPTASSANKVAEKKPAPGFPPAKRSGSVLGRKKPLTSPLRSEYPREDSGKSESEQDHLEVEAKPVEKPKEEEVVEQVVEKVVEKVEVQEPLPEEKEEVKQEETVEMVEESAEVVEEEIKDASNASVASEVIEEEQEQELVVEEKVDAVADCPSVAPTPVATSFQEVEAPIVAVEVKE